MGDGAAPEVALEARSPYELRVDHGAHVPETDVRAALASGDMGFLHSYTTGSAVDGPGVRVVVWTSGCMWRCQYCHNPDTWKIGNGFPVSVTRAATELSKYKEGLKVMSGGLTLSGGEPLMQHRFAVKLLAAVKKMGIHTAIETNGYFADKVSDTELGNVDMVLLGIKSWGDERHKQLTGMEIGHTLAFAERLATLKKPVWIRFVLVPGLTDDPEIAKGIAAFAAGLGNVKRVEVLPFHQLGRFKWKALGLNYTLESTAPPSPELIAQTLAVFRERGLTAY
jgi:pyruvate formate lyase activating enzyme